MNLRTFLDQTGTSIAGFARQIDVHPQAVHRYLNGQRMPKPAYMRKILEVTDGQVTADSFVLHLAPKPQKAA